MGAACMTHTRNRSTFYDVVFLDSNLVVRRYMQLEAHRGAQGHKLHLGIPNDPTYDLTLYANSVTDLFRE